MESPFCQTKIDGPVPHKTSEFGPTDADACISFMNACGVTSLPNKKKRWSCSSQNVRNWIDGRRRVYIFYDCMWSHLVAKKWSCSSQNVRSWTDGLRRVYIFYDCMWSHLFAKQKKPWHAQSASEDLAVPTEAPCLKLFWMYSRL